MPSAFAGASFRVSGGAFAAFFLDRVLAPVTAAAEVFEGLLRADFSTGMVKGEEAELS